jgi:hypothetical protein
MSRAKSAHMSRENDNGGRNGRKADGDLLMVKPAISGWTRYGEPEWQSRVTKQALSSHRLQAGLNQLIKLAQQSICRLSDCL